MNDFEFMLEDRIAKIKVINEQYDLEHNAYLSFSGGKDSTVLHYLIDLALPNNKIPRLFINTGVEYKAIRDFVKTMALNDKRIIVMNSGVNIKKMLEQNGFPRLLGYMLKVEQYNQMLSEDDALKKLQSDYEQLQQFCGIQDKLWHDQVAHLAAEKDDLVSIIKDIQQITKLSISHDGTCIFWETPTEQTFIQDPLLATKLQMLLGSQEEKQ